MDYLIALDQIELKSIQKKTARFWVTYLIIRYLQHYFSLILDGNWYGEVVLSIELSRW